MKGTLTGRCGGCGEPHKGDCCPPHEVRLTGVAWFRGYIEELEAEVERLQGVAWECWRRDTMKKEEAERLIRRKSVV